MFLFRLTVLPRRLKNVGWTKFNFTAVTKDNDVSTFWHNKLNDTRCTNIYQHSGLRGRALRDWWQLEKTNLCPSHLAKAHYWERLMGCSRDAKHRASPELLGVAWRGWVCAVRYSQLHTAEWLTVIAAMQHPGMEAAPVESESRKSALSSIKSQSSAFIDFHTQKNQACGFLL